MNVGSLDAYFDSHSQLSLSKYYLNTHNWFINIFCFSQVLDASQTLLPVAELKKRFEQEGMDSQKLVVQ